MTLVKSAINQFGRDIGKVVSNTALKDAHSTPYRRVGGNTTSKTSQRRSTFKSEFDKAISFQTGFRANTLITKLSGAYTAMKNEANEYVSDGYLDGDESNSFFNMLNKFNDKVDDVCDVLEIDEEGNQKEIVQLTKLLEKTNQIFIQTLQVSSEGCENKKEDYEYLAQTEKQDKLSFFKYVLLKTIWMGKYIETGKKDLVSTIIANILSLFLFPFIHTFKFLQGVFTYSGYNSKKKETIGLYERGAYLEGKRAEQYSEMVDNVEAITI